MSSAVIQNSGSFRDPASHVFEVDGRVFRGLKGECANFTQKFIDSDFASKNLGSSIVQSWKVEKDELLIAGFQTEMINKYDLWLEHEKLEFISYPHEWSFELLRLAALCHLNLNISALQAGFQIKEASSFNIQFKGTNPIFIDIPSFEPYQEGQPWVAYKQFCEMFLAPLAIQSYNRVETQNWLAGSINGINIVDCSSVLPSKSYFNWGLLAHIHLHSSAVKRITAVTSHRKRKEVIIKKQNLLELFKSLRRCIKKLKNPARGYWADYECNTSYNELLNSEKEEIVSKFCANSGIKTLVDIGCNAGQFSDVELKAGVEKIYGLDIDGGALDRACKKSGLDGPRFSPIKYDFSNPSPSLGWNLKERTDLYSRLPKCDGLICLAVIHHLVIAKNIPLTYFVNMLKRFSGKGIVEFVDKNDPMVLGLLQGRKDVFSDYSLENFLNHMRVLFKVQVLESSNLSRHYIKFEEK